jgi:hypothetical protein
MGKLNLECSTLQEMEEALLSFNSPMGKLNWIDLSTMEQ